MQVKKLTDSALITLAAAAKGAGKSLEAYTAERVEEIARAYADLVPAADAAPAGAAADCCPPAAAPATAAPALATA